jgi:hypothetical protein
MIFRIKTLLTVTVIAAAGFALSNVAGCTRKSSVQIGVAPSPRTPSKKLTAADLQKLRWIEGSWRGTGVDQPPFFERYRFENDSTLAVDSFDDEKLTKVSDTSRYELKDGEFGGGSQGSRYVATALDDNSITFEPVVKAHNSFIWKRVSKDSWTAILKWPATKDKPAGERIYNLERWPK